MAWIREGPNPVMITLTFYLDSRAVKPGNPAPLKLSVHRDSKRAFINTGIRLKVNQWDKGLRCVKRRPDAPVLNARLKKLLQDTEQLVWELHGQGRFAGLDAPQIKDILVTELDPERKAAAEDASRLERIMAASVELHSGRTREIYEHTVKRLKAWLGPGYSSVMAGDVTRSWLERFDAFLATTSPKKNARNIHFRNIRAAFNRAIDDGIITCYPFRSFKLRPEPTRKRALSIDQIRKIITAKLPEGTLSYARDLWVMIFCLRGINFVDLCHLTGIDADGCIRYTRAKTHRLYTVKVEPEAAELISRNRGKKWLVCALDRHPEYRTCYFSIRRSLHQLRDFLNADDDGIRIDELSTYYARHSWATIAALLDIPKETIAAGLGHGGNTVTDIYIDFDQRKVDAANRRILDWVFYGRK